MSYSFLPPSRASWICAIQSRDASLWPDHPDLAWRLLEADSKPELARLIWRELGAPDNAWSQSGGFQIVEGHFGYQRGSRRRLLAFGPDMAPLNVKALRDFGAQLCEGDYASWQSASQRGWRWRLSSYSTWNGEGPVPGVRHWGGRSSPERQTAALSLSADHFRALSDLDAAFESLSPELLRLQTDLRKHASEALFIASCWDRLPRARGYQSWKKRRPRSRKSWGNRPDVDDLHGPDSQSF